MDRDNLSETERHGQPPSIDHVLTLINSLVKEVGDTGTIPSLMLL